MLNPLFAYQAIEKLHETKDNGKAVALARRIYRDHFARGSEFEVNVCLLHNGGECYACVSPNGPNTGQRYFVATATHSRGCRKWRYSSKHGTSLFDASQAELFRLMLAHPFPPIRPLPPNTLEDTFEYNIDATK